MTTRKKESARDERAPSHTSASDSATGKRTESSAVSANGKEPPKTKPKGRVVATYSYVDINGVLRYQVQRIEPGYNGRRKRFRQRQPDPTKPSGWTYNLDNVEPLPYRLPELIAAVERGEPILIPEGEKDVDNLVNAGAAATCNPMGAGNWLSEFNQWLSDAHVVIVIDKDPKGFSHALSIHDSLIGFCESVRIVEAKTGKDASDHLAAGHSVEEFVPLTVDELRSRLPSSPAKTESPSGDISVDENSAWWARWGLTRLYKDVTGSALHRGRAVVAYELGLQMGAHKIREDVAEAAMQMFVDMAPNVDSEGADKPYSIQDALITLRSAYKNAEEGNFQPWLSATSPTDPDRLMDGASFILDIPRETPTLCADGDSILWIEGEGLMICGPQGVGKGTIAQQLLLAQIGVREPKFLGLSVRAVERVLYLAMDRPAQIARSLRRMIREEDRQLLGEKLIVWKGPLPFNILKDPLALGKFAEDQGAHVVYVDSYKDLAPGLREDDVGATVNIAVQEVLARGIELCGLHHQRKAQADNRRPTSLDDVYGSNWLTAGLGSVALLWGKPGADVVELTHLKQPMEAVGPLNLKHDHASGTTSLRNVEADLLGRLIAKGSTGMTEEEAALLLYGTAEANEKRRARRRLEKLVAEGCAMVEEGKKGGVGGGGTAARWTAL